MAREFLEGFAAWIEGEGPAPYDVGEQESDTSIPLFSKEDFDSLLGVEEEYTPLPTTSVQKKSEEDLQYIPTPREILNMDQQADRSGRTKTVQIPHGPQVQVPPNCREFRTEWGGYRWRIRFNKSGEPRFMKPKKLVFFFKFEFITES